MKKTTLIIIALLLSGSISFAKDRNRDVVYLKNGSIIKGQILTDLQGFKNLEGLVKIRTKDNSLWVFKAVEIDRISRSHSDKPGRSDTLVHKGYFNLTEAGILAGNSKNEYEGPFSLMNISGWKFKNNFSVGIGTGIEMMSETYLPVVADIRYNLKKHGASPFFGVQGGYTFALDKPDPQYVYTTTGIWRGSGSTMDMKARGGFLLNPSVGLITPINESMALTFSAGYRIMRHRYQREDNYNIDMDYNRLSVKIGLLFQ